MNRNEIILFETADNEVKLNVNIDGDTVWLNRAQLAELFDRDIKTIGKHINNTLKEELREIIQLSQNLRQLLLTESLIRLITTTLMS